MLFISIFFLTCLLKLYQSKQEYGCYDPNGKFVDWYIIFLYPSTSREDKKLSYGYYDEKSGLNFYYFDSKTFPPIRDTHEVDDIKANDKVNYFFWNDDTSTEDTPSSASSGKAHAKGGLVYDKTTGYFLLHSLPRFPRRTSSNQFIDELPDNAGIYGQHFLCMTTNLDNNIKIIKTLNIINPQIVISNGEDDNVGYETNEVLKLIKNRFDKNLPPQLTSSIKTNSGKEFIFFSRSRNEESLQYDTLIPQYFQDDFFVETWTKPKMLDPICKGPYEVRNVKKLKFNEWEYISSQEHSKWAVSVKKDISCFGDLNRTLQKTIRGGSVVCVKDKKLSSAMRDAIVEADSCGKLKFLE